MTDVTLADFVFTRPLLVDVPLEPGELVMPGDLVPHQDRIRAADALLIRSGWQRHRAGNPHRYEHEGPGFGSAAAQWLRRHHPQVRAIALDWLSVCSLRHLDDGVAAHRALLRPASTGEWVTIFEDVDLAALADNQPQWLLAAPLFIPGLDGSPCTIVAAIGE